MTTSDHPWLGGPPEGRATSPETAGVAVPSATAVSSQQHRETRKQGGHRQVGAPLPASPRPGPSRSPAQPSRELRGEVFSSAQISLLPESLTPTIKTGRHSFAASQLLVAAIKTSSRFISVMIIFL